MTNRLICLLAALAIAVPAAALPATAFGQSAGDDQYVDPFQDNGNNGNNGGGNGGNGGNDNSGSQSDNTSAGQHTQTTTTTGDTAGASAQDQAAESGGLPRTGFDVGGVVLLGVLLLGGGLALRRAWPLPE